MYKYTKKVTLKSGTAWKFVPPQDAIDSILYRKNVYEMAGTNLPFYSA